jgi:hypothetical protein
MTFALKCVAFYAVLLAAFGLLVTNAFDLFCWADGLIGSPAPWCPL